MAAYCFNVLRAWMSGDLVQDGSTLLLCAASVGRWWPFAFRV